MLDDRTGVNGTGESAGEAPRYFIELGEASDRERSMALLISARKCYTHQQADADAGIETTDGQAHMGQIVDHCGSQNDYLLPDTPLKEAIFRVILAADNEPMSAAEISVELSNRWAGGPGPRDTSPGVIQRLLDNSPSYQIMRVPEPEPELEPAPEPEPVAEQEAESVEPAEPETEEGA